MITLWRDKQILPESMFQPKDSGFGSRRQVIINLIIYIFYMNIHTQLAIIPLIDQAYKNAFYEDMNAIFAMLFFAMYHLWQEKETPQWYLEDNWVLLVWVSGLCILERLRKICQNFPKNRELFGDVKMLKTPPRRSNVRCISFTCISPLKLPTCREHTPYTWGSGPGNSLW